MRVSVYQNDDGYVPDSCRYRVTLDDEALETCVTADEEKSEALCFERDPNGKIVVDETGEDAKMILRRGVVKIWQVPEESEQEPLQETA